MHFPQATLAFLLAANSLALPVPQLAGEGAACNSVLSQTDNGIGYGIENAEENTANTISGAHARLFRRQLAGEGAACDSILTQTDNGVGHGIENAEENTANNISKLPKVPARRQLDKVSNGFQAISNAAGTGDATSAVTTELDDIDGQSTGGAADLGKQIGDTEDATLEGLGKAVPKVRRQGDKISNGFQAIGNAAGVGDLTGPTTTGLDGVDGTTTSAGAQLGAEVGDIEDGTLENAGKRIP